MEHDLSWLKSMIATRAHEMWDRENRPYYISFVATDAAKEGVDYKGLIKPLKLRQWALTEEIDGLKVVEHPHHKAKVGFIPVTAEYTFDDLSTTGSDPENLSANASNANKFCKPSRVNTVTNSRRATLHFLEMLSKLDDDELNTINIPIRTIVRLLNG